DLEGDQRAFGVQRLERIRMQFAEMAEHVLRPDLDRARAAWMKPGRPARYNLHSLRRRAGRHQNTDPIRLGIEGVDLAVALGPMAPEAGRLRQGTPHPGGGRKLILGPIAAKDLTDFEQAHVGEASISISLRRRN